MNTFTILLIIVSECCSIVGQLFFKVAMGEKWESSRKQAWAALGAGVAAMAVGFFVWLGLMAKFELSFLYPFEGVNRIILLRGAIVFLKEKIAPRLWVGVLLISIGIAIVAAS